MSELSCRPVQCTCSGHAGDVETLLPLLLDPFKGEGIADFIALLCIPSAFAHDHQRAAMATACTKLHFLVSFEI